MTLEQSTRRILAAVEAQDLAALQAAAKGRESAMAMLASIPPTPELRKAMAASITAGEEATRAIRGIRQRIRKDSRRLANIERGFLGALFPLPEHRIDYKG
jgi:hypothetical protein